MRYVGLPPGTIIQQLYLRKRIKIIRQGLVEGTFLDVGAGEGYASQTLLSCGYKGIGIDLNKEACLENEKRNRHYVTQGKYKVIDADFLSFPFTQKFDVIVSSMVIEHLDDHDLDLFMKKFKSLINEGGVIILLVPANMKYWGVEDEVVGHFKRYEVSDVNHLCKKYNFSLHKIAALTYPLSNWLLNLSNYLIKRHENQFLSLSQREKTIRSSKRGVPLKTTFPFVFKLFLNEVVLYPFYLLQSFYLDKYSEALVLYMELK